MHRNDNVRRDERREGNQLTSTVANQVNVPSNRRENRTGAFQ